MLIMPSSAGWKWKRLRYKPLENRVYNGNSDWLTNTASKIQCYDTKPRPWDPSSASDLRLADKHLTTELTNGYRFGVFVVSCFFFYFFFFFMQAEPGKWRKFVGAKQNWPIVQKFPLVSFWYFSPSLILSQVLRLRRCHDSALDEHFILADDFFHFSFTNSFNRSFKGHRLGYLEWRRPKKDQYLCNGLFCMTLTERSKENIPLISLKMLPRAFPGLSQGADFAASYGSHGILSFWATQKVPVPAENSVKGGEMGKIRKFNRGEPPVNCGLVNRDVDMLN